jgi:carbamoyl-phosphate synthase large subunit
MEIVYQEDELKRYLRDAVKVSNDSPVLLDHFLNCAIEVDIDAVSDGKQVVIGAIMQHIEQAGVHSGDSACSLPPYSLPADVQDEMLDQVKRMALELGVIGLMNVQLALQGDRIYVIEVNPRASRTVPFVSKCIGKSLAKIAARVMAGEPLSYFPLRAPYAEDAGYDDVLPLGDPMTLADPNMPWFSVKEAVLPFARFPGVDTILGPEMRSTGEVMGWDRSFPRAFLKAQMGAGTILPEEGNVFFSIKDSDKSPELVETAQVLVDLGMKIIATRGTAAFLKKHNIACQLVNKVYEGRPNIVDMMKDEQIALVMNTTEGAMAVEDSREIRSVALYDKIPYYTTAAGAHAAALAMKERGEAELVVKPLQG